MPLDESLHRPASGARPRGYPRLLAAAAPLALLLGCLAGGGGSDTETLTGRLLAPDGRPAPGVEVTLVPEAYDPSRPDPERVRTAITDAEGRYAFPKAAGGTYNLVAREAPGAYGFPGGAGAFAGGLAGDSLPGALTLGKARVFYISLHDDAYTAADSGTAWFPGTDILVRCDGGTATPVGSLPAGLDSLVLESRAGWRHGIRVDQPGDSLDIAADRRGVRVSPR